MKDKHAGGMWKQNRDRMLFFMTEGKNKHTHWHCTETDRRYWFFIIGLKNMPTGTTRKRIEIGMLFFMTEGKISILVGITRKLIDDAVYNGINMPMLTGRKSTMEPAEVHRG